MGGGGFVFPVSLNFVTKTGKKKICGENCEIGEFFLVLTFF